MIGPHQLMHRLVHTCGCGRQTCSSSNANNSSISGSKDVAMSFLSSVLRCLLIALCRLSNCDTALTFLPSTSSSARVLCQARAKPETPVAFFHVVYIRYGLTWFILDLKFLIESSGNLVFPLLLYLCILCQLFFCLCSSMLFEYIEPLHWNSIRFAAFGDEGKVLRLLIACNKEQRSPES